MNQLKHANNVNFLQCCLKLQITNFENISFRLKNNTNVIDGSVFGGVRLPGVWLFTNTMLSTSKRCHYGWLYYACTGAPVICMMLYLQSHIVHGHVTNVCMYVLCARWPDRKGWKRSDKIMYAHAIFSKRYCYCIKRGIRNTDVCFNK